MIWRKFFRRKRADAELTQEMDLHLAQEIDENIARGILPDEARRRARIKFGNPQLVRENLWRQNTLTVTDNLWHDLRYAIRTLTRSPGFTLIAVLVMALGIGANVALFTVVRSVLLKPLPYRDPGRLALIYEADNDQRHASPWLPVDAGSFWEWQGSAQSQAQMAMVSPFQGYNVSAEGGKLPEVVEAAWCTDNFFSLLGVQPMLGRGFTAEDDHPGAAATAILSASLWKRRYASDPAILGK